MRSHATTKVPGPGRRSERGFTLVEALVSIVILAFGLIAISNLLLVAGTSNAVANRSTAAAALASQQMERLKAVPFPTLAAAAGGDLDANTGPPNAGCTTAVGTYNCWQDIAGVGRVTVRWLIVPAAAANTLFITVRAESQMPFMGARTRAEFTSFRVQS